ncbi:MAG: hypothetical protein Q7T05_08660 [Dehalococcoidia bacterium]|nr:hypothetical protein [Dehalococcoidia bacterium]
MNTKNWLRFLSVLAVTLIALAAMVIPFSPPVRADVAAAQITAFEVVGPDGKPITNEPLRAGAVYTVNLTVNVAAGINGNGVLTTSLTRPQGFDRFWTLKAPAYAGINTTTWQPGQQQVAFQAVQGVIQMQLQGAVPLDYVLTKLSNGDIIHVARDISLVQLSLSSGPVLEDKKLQVIDNDIDAYRKALAGAKALVTDSTADAKYTKLVASVVAQAQATGNAGYTDRAVALLAAIPPQADWIAPRGSTAPLWIVIGVLALLALLLGYLFMRTRGESGLLRSQADEQAKRLELASAKATRIGDASLAGDINKVKSELEKLAGR